MSFHWVCEKNEGKRWKGRGKSKGKGKGEGEREEKKGKREGDFLFENSIRKALKNRIGT